KEMRTLRSSARSKVRAANPLSVRSPGISTQPGVTALKRHPVPLRYSLKARAGARRASRPGGRANAVESSDTGNPDVPAGLGTAQLQRITADNPPTSGRRAERKRMGVGLGKAFHTILCKCHRFRSL